MIREARRVAHMEMEVLPASPEDTRVGKKEKTQICQSKKLYLHYDAGAKMARKK